MSAFKIRTSPAAQFIKLQLGRALCRSVKNFIFVATTGRSGSKTLYQLCRSIPKCAAFHEPMPEMNADILYSFNNYEEHIMLHYFKSFKLPAIYKASLHQNWYVETNHTFIKCFSDAAVKEFGNRLKVIHLVRDRHEVAKSWLHRGSIPGTGRKGAWLIDPYAPRNLIKFDKIVTQNSHFAHDYFKCLWYWYEIEARTKKFILSYPQISIYHLQTRDLNNLDILSPIFNDLFFGFNQEILTKQVGLRVNNSKQKPGEPFGIERKVIDAFDSLCQELFSSLTI
jgi:hypothetical protein